jgi:hypothetical protein
VSSAEAERRGASGRSKNDLACTPEIRGAQKAWFADLRARVAAGQPYVYTDAFGPHEILEAFDLPHVINEWWSGIVAARRQSAHYFDFLEQRGFHAGLERYTALGLASVLDRDNPEPPWGGLPRPAFICGSLMSARPFAAARWQLLAEAWDVPAFILETPSAGRPMPTRWWESSRHGWEQLYPTWQLDRMTGVFWDLIAWCERATGRKFDLDKLREVMARANRQQAYFEEVRNVIVAGKVPVSMSEQLGNVMTIQWRRGSEWATDAARQFRDEVLQRAAAGQWICPDERFRLMWHGAGLWQNTSFYRAFEQQYGAVFVRSMYMSIAIDGYPRYGNDPVRALASRYCGIGLGSIEWDIHEARLHRVDGVVATASTVNSRVRSAFEQADLPLLVLDVDLVDGRTWDEEAVQRQMADFIERRLEPRKAGAVIP